MVWDVDGGSGGGSSLSGIRRYDCPSKIVTVVAAVEDASSEFFGVLSFLGDGVLSDRSKGNARWSTFRNELNPTALLVRSNVSTADVEEFVTRFPITADDGMFGRNSVVIRTMLQVVNRSFVREGIVRRVHCQSTDCARVETGVILSLIE